MHKKTPSGHDLNPETLALNLGYDPKLSEGSIKPPIFLTSTFQFNSAADGKRFFEVAYGIREQEPNEKLGLIYSRINNPNLQIFEERIAAWDETECAAVFSSGMAAISTTFFAVVRPGDIVLTTSPVYGGTHYFFHKILPQFGITVHMVPAGNNAVKDLEKKAKEVGEKKVKAIYIETPANPSNILTDIQGCSKLAVKLSKLSQRKVLTMVDNTFLGPLFQRPATLGADIMIYSATKFIGGHSDLVAGVVTGKQSLIDPIKGFRTILGTVAPPFTDGCFTLARNFVDSHAAPSKDRAQNRGLSRPTPKGHRRILSRTAESGRSATRHLQTAMPWTGSLVSFDVRVAKKGLSARLIAFRVCRLAVSLGGTESLWNIR